LMRSNAAYACTMLNILFLLSLVWCRTVVFWFTLSKQTEKHGFPEEKKW
jgi:hypothetical protein